MSDLENQTAEHPADEIYKDPTGLIKLPKSSVRVEDPEEEVFLLYTNLSSRKPHDISSVSSFPGLGSVDSRQDTLTVRFSCPPRQTAEAKTRAISRQARESGPSTLDGSGTKSSSRVSKAKKADKRPSKLLVRSISPKTSRASGSRWEERALEIELVQDKTALRSKKGDTGSVLWRVSVVLGQALLTDLCSEHPFSLFYPDKLKNCNVLELGAGTGLLSLVLAPWVKHYTVTDLDYLVPLIRKNTTTNLSVVQKTIGRPAEHSIPRRPKGSLPATGLRGNGHEDQSLEDKLIIVKPLDWLELQRATPHIRRTAFHFTHADPPDLIVIADCVYNPALLSALLATVDYYAAPMRTCVLVAVELRSADVVREFLQIWLRLGSWEIWRVGSRDGDVDDGNNDGFLGVDFAVWAGWKVD